MLKRIGILSNFKVSYLNWNINNVKLYRGKKQFSSMKHNFAWAYEISQYSNPDSECSLLEKSIRNGCRFILTQSSETLKPVLELIQDLHLTDEIVLDQFSIGHRLRYKKPKQGNIDYEAIYTKWLNELDDIKFHLSAHHLKYVTLPYEMVSKEPCPSIQTDFIFKLQTMFPDIKIGLDFTTELLGKFSNEDIDSALDTIDFLHKTRFNHEIPFFPVQTITVACNGYTYLPAKTLLHIANKLQIPSAATEVLRIHKRRPGLCTMPKGLNIKEEDVINPKLLEYAPPLLTSSTATEAAVAMQSSSSKDSSLENKTKYQMDLLQRAFNACIDLERQFLRRFPESPLSPEQVGWGHRLAQTTHAPVAGDDAANEGLVLYAEEWDYLLRHLYEPGLRELTTALRRGGGASVDWIIVYKPLAAALFRAYTAVLQDRKVLLCADVRDALHARRPAPGDEPKEVGLLAASLGPHLVCLADTQISSDLWKTSESELYDVDSALAIWQSIRTIYDIYAE